MANLTERTTGRYKEGETVYAKVNPKQRLTVRCFLDQIYYCRITNEPNKKELVFFERELQSLPDPPKVQ